MQKTVAFISGFVLTFFFQVWCYHFALVISIHYSIKEKFYGSVTSVDFRDVPQIVRFSDRLVVTHILRSRKSKYCSLSITSNVWRKP